MHLCSGPLGSTKATGLPGVSALAGLESVEFFASLVMALFPSLVVSLPPPPASLPPPVAVCRCP